MKNFDDSQQDLTTPDSKKLPEKNHAAKLGHQEHSDTSSASAAETMHSSLGSKDLSSTLINISTQDEEEKASASEHSKQNDLETYKIDLLQYSGIDDDLIKLKEEAEKLKESDINASNKVIKILDEFTAFKTKFIETLSIDKDLFIKECNKITSFLEENTNISSLIKHLQAAFKFSIQEISFIDETRTQTLPSLRTCLENKDASPTHKEITAWFVQKLEDILSDRKNWLMGGGKPNSFLEKIGISVDSSFLNSENQTLFLILDLALSYRDDLDEESLDGDKITLLREIYNDEISRGIRYINRPLRINLLDPKYTELTEYFNSHLFKHAKDISEFINHLDQKNKTSHTIPPIQLYNARDAVEIEELFLPQFKISALYSDARERHNTARKQFKEAKDSRADTSSALKELKKAHKPMTQLSPKGLAILSHLFAEKEDDPRQPLIASSSDALSHIAQLMFESKNGTQCAVIFQPAGDGDLPYGVSSGHKTTVHFEKKDNGLFVICTDSVNNDWTYEFIKQKILSSINKQESDKIFFYKPDKSCKAARQKDVYQCGIFAIKDARELNRNRSKYILDNNTYTYTVQNPAYFKMVQSEREQDEYAQRFSESAANRKNESLATVYQKKRVKSSENPLPYVGYFSRKYFILVKKYWEENQSNNDKMRSDISQYDAQKMTSELLHSVYGPKVTDEPIPSANEETPIQNSQDSISAAAEKHPVKVAQNQEDVVLAEPSSDTSSEVSQVNPNVELDEEDDVPKADHQQQRFTSDASAAETKIHSLITAEKENIAKAEKAVTDAEARYHNAMENAPGVKEAFLADTDREAAILALQVARSRLAAAEAAASVTIESGVAASSSGNITTSPPNVDSSLTDRFNAFKESYRETGIYALEEYDRESIESESTFLHANELGLVYIFLANQKYKLSPFSPMRNEVDIIRFLGMASEQAACQVNLQESSDYGRNYAKNPQNKVLLDNIQSFVLSQETKMAITVAFLAENTNQTSHYITIQIEKRKNDLFEVVFLDSVGTTIGRNGVLERQPSPFDNLQNVIIEAMIIEIKPSASVRFTHPPTNPQHGANCIIEAVNQLVAMDFKLKVQPLTQEDIRAVRSNVSKILNGENVELLDPDVAPAIESKQTTSVEPAGRALEEASNEVRAEPRVSIQKSNTTNIAIIGVYLLVFIAVGAGIGAGIGFLVPLVGAAIGALFGVGVGLIAWGWQALIRKQNHSTGTRIPAGILSTLGAAGIGALLGISVFPGIGMFIGAAIGAGIGAMITGSIGLLTHYKKSSNPELPQNLDHSLGKKDISNPFRSPKLSQNKTHSNRVHQIPSADGTRHMGKKFFGSGEGSTPTDEKANKLSRS